MANTLTNVLPVLAQAAQVVSREACGMLRSVDLRGSAEPVALGQTVNIPKNPAIATGAWAASLMPSLADRTVTGLQLTLSTAKKVDWHLTSEHQRGMDSGNSTAMDDFKRQAEQAMRAISNEIEAYLWDLAYKATSRAVGTAATTPFASSLADAASVGRILNENGAPVSGRSLVLNPAAYANVQAQFANVASTRDPASFTDGDLPMISGLQPRISPQVGTHTAGTSSGHLLNESPSAAIGDTTLTLDTGTGTILVGDVIQTATGGRYYGVKTALTGADVVINDPGIYGAALANNAAILVQASHVANVALTRDAVMCVVRPPAQAEGSQYMEHTAVVDPVSGIPFGVCKIVGDGAVFYSVRAIYGALVIESGHIARLMG